jgi:hypothetical protein
MQQQEALQQGHPPSRTHAPDTRSAATRTFRNRGAGRSFEYGRRRYRHHNRPLPVLSGGYPLGSLAPMLAQVLDGALKDGCIILELTQCGIACHAQQAAYLACAMVMI